MDSFIRSVDEADRDRHVVAYWRFEDSPLGGDLPHTMQNQRSVRATIDSLFNGNDLFAYTDLSHPSFLCDVPAPPVVGRSGQAEPWLLGQSARPPGQTRNLYTHSAFSHALGRWTCNRSYRGTGRSRARSGRQRCMAARRPSWAATVTRRTRRSWFRVALPSRSTPRAASRSGSSIHGSGRMRP